jgi:hypothetical protein
MSTEVTTRIRCDRFGCLAREPVSIGEHVAEARKRAHSKGWRSVHRYRSGLADYCPNHQKEAK